MAFVFPTSPQGYGQQSAANTPVINMGAADYIFLDQSGLGGDGNVHVFKRLAAATTWIVQDNGHSPHLNDPPYLPVGGAVQFCCWGDSANSTIFILVIKQSGASPTVALDGWDVFSFNTSTDLWNSAGSPVHSYVNGVGGTTMSFIRGNGGGLDQISQQAFLNMWTRGPGDYIFFYSGTPQNIAGTNWGRLYYSTYNGTTFGASVLLNNQVGNAIPYCGIGGCHDTTNGDDHFFAIDFFVNKTLIHWSLRAGLLGNAQVVNTAFPTGVYYSNFSEAVGTMSVPIVYFNASNAEKLGIVGEFWNEPFDGSQALVAFTAAVSQNPVWSSAKVSVGSDDTNFNFPSHSDTNLFPVVQGITGFPMPSIGLAVDSASHTMGLYWVVTDDGTLAGHVFGATSVNDGVTWAALSANALDALNLSPADNGMNEVYAWPQAGGGIGVIGSQLASGDFSEATQYAVQAFAAPPTCSLSAFPTSITIENTSLLSWTSTNTPTSGTIDNGIGSVSVPTGSVVVSPTVTTTYHLLVTNATGSSTCQATVTVTGPTTPTIPPNTPCARKIDCVIQLYKHPLDAIDMTLNWDGWLEDGDAVATSAWASDVGLTLGTATVTGNATAVRVSGGTDTFAYLLRNMVTTDFGLTELRSAAVNVIACHTDPPDPYMRSTEEDLFQLIKNPLANVDLAMDWSSWLNGDQIANFSFVPDAGIAVTAIKFSRTATLARVTGGTAGMDYLVEHVILTQQGRTGIRHVAILVRSCS